ncbi:MAG: ATP-binding protein [Kiritimatiellae bacterium]|nr:ATP-binding protein [Kiritimatiellia bacterium]
MTANVRLRNLISTPAYKIGSLTKHLSADLSQLEHGAPPVFLASTENTPPPPADSVSNRHGESLSIKVPIFCFGKTYALEISAKPEGFKNYPVQQHKIILLGGLLLTAALTIMVALLTNRRTFLEQKVMDQTAALRQGRDNLSAVFDAAPAAMLVTDGNSDIVDANLGAEKLFSQKLHNLPYPRLGHLIGCLHCRRPDLLCGNTDFCHECPLNNAVKSVSAGGEPVCNEDVNVRINSGNGDKQVWLRVNATPVTFNGQPHVLVSLHDITCEIELHQQLRQASKMDAIGRLAGGVAHDFNNLLQAILGFTELLLTGLDAKDHQYSDLKQIEKAARRAADLTRQLLAFSRRQKIETCPVDLNETVRTTDTMLRRILGEDIKIAHNLSPEVKPVLADPTQIEQVIVNLAVNARDSMPKGGCLTFGTSPANFSSCEDTRLVPESVPGRFVCLSVTDTGMGISPENMPHIFEPFFTTKLSGKGTGLGLSVIYGIVKQSGGWINVYSEPGQGSTFKIYLPATDLAVTGQTEDHDQPLPISLPGLGQQILLVEDEPEVRALVSLILRGAGYKVVACENAAAAITAFDRQKDDFDLLFSDIILGGMNGVDLACLLRKLRPDLPVLLSSGYSDERVRWELIEREGFRFLSKPCPSSKMLTVIGEMLVERNNAKT